MSKEKLEPSISEQPPLPKSKRPKMENIKMNLDKGAVEEEARQAYLEARKKWQELKPEDEMKLEKRKAKELARQKEQKKSEYVQNHLPDYLQGKQGKPSFVSGIFGWMMKLKEKFGKVKVSGRENIPQQGPYLVVSNHSGGETAALYGVFDKQPLRVTAGEELNWKRSGFRAWLLRKLGMIPVKESLANSSAEQKQELLKRVPGKVRKEAYGRIVEREQKGELTLNREYIRSTVASLLHGDAVAVFPEGLFLYDNQRSLRQAYGGVEVIAREYKRVTGDDLPILPFGISQKQIGIGETIRLSENGTSLKDADWIMTHVARQLPENERGVYRDLAENIS